MSQLVGYARVSTAEQNPAAQLDMLKAANCERVFVETASGAQRNWPELAKALDYMRAGDVLVVWRLDRLTRSVRPARGYRERAARHEHRTEIAARRTSRSAARAPPTARPSASRPPSQKAVERGQR